MPDRSYLVEFLFSFALKAGLSPRDVAFLASRGGACDFFVQNTTAPKQEHDFEGSEDPKQIENRF